MRIAERRKGYEVKTRPMPDLPGIMANLMERTTPPMRVTRRTLMEILRRTRNLSGVMDNPHEFASVAV